MEKFIILSRYEHWDKNNKKTWCKWFVVDSKPRTLEEATKRIKDLKTSSAEITKETKLKHEYKTIPVKNIR